MMKRAALLGLVAIVLPVLSLGCVAETDTSGGSIGTDDDMEVVARDPVAMPKPILTFLKTNGWGSHHLEWHTVRNWDRLGASDQAYAKRQGWARADLQEGTKGNGLEFLAMHRVMFRILTERFPESADLFHGWDPPPTDPKDAHDPVPRANTQEFDENKKAAIDKLQNHLADFKSDDELGLFIETSMRPTAKDPTARSADKSAGIHNYLHNRFSGDSKAVDIGDPSVNLQNRRFWRLHGWIESRWTAFRAMKKLGETDPAYQAALKKGEDMLLPKSKGLPGGAAPEPPPESLRKFFAQNP
jgi:hypothetical protein